MTILLTGATGMVGSYLLREFLLKTSHRLVVLIRATDSGEALRRLQAVISGYDPEFDISRYAGRVDARCGDVRQTRLGLSAEEIAWLAREVDTTVHAAALTNLVGLPEDLLATNLHGTRNIANLVTTFHSRRFVYLSSYSIVGSRLFDPACEFSENDFDVGQNFTMMPYQESKFLAERYLSGLDLDWLIFRLGNVFGPSNSGLLPPSFLTGHSLFLDILTSAVRAGYAMSSPGYFFDVTPVDYICAGIRELLNETPQQRFHLVQPNPWSMQAILETFREFGWSIQGVGPELYGSQLRRGCLFRPGHRPFRSMTTFVFDRWINVQKIDFNFSGRVTCARTTAQLREHGVEYPENFTACLATLMRPLLSCYDQVETKSPVVELQF